MMDKDQLDLIFDAISEINNDKNPRNLDYILLEIYASFHQLKQNMYLKQIVGRFLNRIQFI